LYLLALAQRNLCGVSAGRHFSLENLTFVVYISNSDYTPDFLSQERRFCGVFAICGTPMGTESKYVTMFYIDALHVGGKVVRSPLDGLKSSSGKGSYMDLHKIPG